MNNGTVIQFDILGSQEDTGGIVSINGLGREPVKNWPVKRARDLLGRRRPDHRDQSRDGQGGRAGLPQRERADVDAEVTTRWPRAGLGIALALSVAWSMAPRLGSAAGDVTLCQSDDQSGPGLNLQSALQGGGTVTFSCGGQATIRITRTHVLTSSTIVDGRGGITLDAEGRQLTMFKVGAHEVGLDLVGLTLVRSRRPQASGGGPIDIGAGGSVVASSVYRRLRFTLQSVTVRDNESPILVYGADAEGTTLVVRNSEFRNNLGAAVTVTGTASGTVMQCAFDGNEIGIHVLERMTVEQSSFSRHTAGAISRDGASSSRCATAGSWRTRPRVGARSPSAAGCARRASRA